MSEFTKGKWEYDKPFGVIFSYETYAVIANVQGAGTGSCFCSTQEGQANARLIAAAPDMYELLYEALQELKGYDPLGNGISTIYPDIEELLARIHGDNMKGGE